MVYITDAKKEVRIGAMTSLREITLSPMIREQFPALSQAAQDVGAYAHQVMGTLGGNLCQANRCRYYNQSAFWRSVRPPCYKRGGHVCYVVPGHQAQGSKAVQCHSTYCGDIAPALIALDAKVSLMGPEGDRKIPAKKLYTYDGKKPLALKKGEILKEILLPFPSSKSRYLKIRRRDTIEFPVVSLAVRLDLGDDGRITKTRVVLSGVGPGPVEAVETEKILKEAHLDETIIENASRRVTKEISPVRTSTASPAYQRKMAGVLLKQALEEMTNLVGSGRSGHPLPTERLVPTR
jgi:4-hydroxybenzoyl-CoA reductase subunit beta